MPEVEQEKTPAQGIWCGKMCPELSAPTKEPISASCSKKQQKWPANKPPLFLCLKTDGLQPDALPMWEDNGALRGEYLMHSFGVCPKDENASHLSQILEASPHPKYSLSAKACLGILNRAERRGKVLPEILKQALIQQAQRGAYCIQGNCIDRADTAGCNGKGWTEGVSYTLNTIDRPAVLPFACNQRDEARLLGDKAVALQAQPGMKQQTFLVSDSSPFVPSPPQSKDAVLFEPESSSRVGGHIWQDGKAPALRADAGDNRPAIALEHHPNDSRVKISEDGIVQTLNARMGMGGGNVPMVMYENYQFANYRQECGTLKAIGCEYGGGSENLLVQISVLER